MKKIVSSHLNLCKTNLISTGRGAYLTDFNLYVPLRVLNINLILKTVQFSCLSSCNYLGKIFLLSRSWFTKKLKFRHKISWFYMKRRFYKLFFCHLGKSHLVFHYLLTYVKRRKRYTTNNSLIFYSLNWKLLNSYCCYLRSLQPINSYTSRGLKFSRQLIYKKQGKVSKYSGLKSKIF